MGNQSSIKIQTESHPINFIEPFKAFLALRAHFGEENVYLLESLSGPEADKKASFIGFHPLLTLKIFRNKVYFFGLPALIEKITAGAISTGTLIEENNQYIINDKQGLWNLLRTIQSKFSLKAENAGSGFSCGFFGYFGYDTAWSVEKLPYLIPARHDIPEVCLTICQTAIKFNLESHSAQLIINQAPEWWSNMSVAQIKELLTPAKMTEIIEPAANIPKPINRKDSIKRDAYLEDVKKALKYVSIGDIYQVQIGHEIAIESAADPLTVYQRLRQRNPSPYMYLAPFGGNTIIGASPELFIRVENNRIISRPIAGTARRGKSTAEDEKAIQALKQDEKEVAEHIMLVDLARNDVGRVCKANTLQVDELMIVEKYSHVLHMVSNVSADLRDDVDSYEVIAANFPAGTVTGAPKIRAMEIIEEIETKRRGLYAGALGLIDFNGYMNLALCIRTIEYTDQVYCIRASAGIVADSVPEKEWQETLLKLGATHWAITDEEFPNDYTGY